jgi:hypothetical protein
MIGTSSTRAGVNVLGEIPKRTEVTRFPCSSIEEKECAEHIKVNE